jgi:hypothetical protein
MTTQQIIEKIKKESGLKVSVKKGYGSMTGYVIFSTKKTEQFDFSYSRNFITQFPECSVNPPFANNYQICIYHGITR